MSQKLHCDMCDREIRATDERAGSVKAAQLFPVALSVPVDVDLCMVHFDAFTRLFRLWETTQQGGYTSDNDRINALKKVDP